MEYRQKQCPPGIEGWHTGRPFHHHAGEAGAGDSVAGTLGQVATCLRQTRICGASWDTLATEVARLAAGQTQAVAKIVLTRGSGGRGYDGAGCNTPTRIVSLAPYPAHYLGWQQNGIATLICQQQLGDAPMLAGLKTLGRLEQVLLKSELAARGGVEGIVLNSRGFLVEGVSANLFWRRGKTVFTPDLPRRDRWHHAQARDHDA